MMKLNRKIVSMALLLTGMLMFWGCEKDVISYSQDPRVYFFERANDLTATRITSRSYTFLTLEESRLKDTLYIKVKTMGDTAGYDRYVIGKAIQDTLSNAVQGQDYDFIPGLIEAGKTEGNLAIVLYRTAKLKNETLVLNLTIGESEDFKGGVVEDEKFKLTWSDRLVQPDTWPFYFGTYSDVKYRFVIDVLGIADFPAQICIRCAINPGEYSVADLQDMASILRVRLREYNASNPANPLRDENGMLIVF